MKFSKSFLAATALSASGASAQIAESYTDAETGIFFQRFYAEAYGFSWGIVFPPNPTTDSEFIGQIVGNNNGGWSGVSLGGGMVNNLLVITWLNGDEVVPSLRIAPGYVAPEIYDQPGPKLTTLHTSVNETHYSYTFRCEGCTKWNEWGGFDPSSGFAVQGWAASLDPPADASDPASSIFYHNNGFGQYGVILSDATSDQYQSWIEKYSGSGVVVEPTESASPTPTETPTPVETETDPEPTPSEVVTPTPEPTETEEPYSTGTTTIPISTPTGGPYPGVPVKPPRWPGFWWAPPPKPFWPWWKAPKN